MAGLTLSALYNRVGNNLEDTAFTYTQKAWIVNWINDAITEVCAEGQLIKRYVQFAPNPNPVVLGNASAEYVPALTDPTSLDQVIFLQAGQLALSPSTPDELAAERFDWDTRTGTPTDYLYNYWSPGVLRLFPDPGPNSGLNVRGFATLKPQALLVGTDDNTLPPFDSEFHILCEYYATARGYGIESERFDLQKAQLWAGLYTEKLAKLKAKQGRNFSVAARHVRHENF